MVCASVMVGRNELSIYINTCCVRLGTENNIYIYRCKWGLQCVRLVTKHSIIWMQVGTCSVCVCNCFEVALLNEWETQGDEDQTSDYNVAWGGAHLGGWG